MIYIALQIPKINKAHIPDPLFKPFNSPNIGVSIQTINVEYIPTKELTNPNVFKFFIFSFFTNINLFLNTRTYTSEIFLSINSLCPNDLFMDNISLEPIEQYVIDTVRKMRLDKNISQKELAYSLNLSIGFIGDVESSKSRAKYNISHINKLAEYFECSPKDFLPQDPFREE